MKIAQFAILTLLCLHFAVCQAQQDAWFSERYHLSHYTDENGLPQNSVKSITADNAGFIWLTTENGLVRYDGQQFYSYNKSNTAIPNARFYSLQRDLNGNLEKLFTYPPNPDQTSMRVQSGIAIPDSVHGGRGVNRMLPLKNFEMGQFLSCHIPSGWEKRPSGDSVDYVIQGSSGVGCYYKLRASKISFYEQWKNRWEIKLASPYIEDYFCLKKDLYRFSSEGTLQRVNETGVHDIVISGDFIRDPGYESGKYNFQLFWDSSSDKVFVSLNKNFYQLEPVTTRQWKSTLILSEFDFDVNTIIAAYYNNVSGTLLLGSVTRGLFVFTPKRFRTLLVNERDEDNVIYAQTPFGRDKVLTPNGIVLGLSKDGASIPVKLPLIYNVKTTDKRAIVTDESGNIWLKSFHSLYKFSSDGKKSLGVWEFEDEIKTIYVGHHGKIWLGMKSAGLSFIDVRGEGAKPVTIATFPKGALSAILQINDDELWLGMEQGLYYWKHKTGKVVLVPGTDKLHVRSLYQSPSFKEGIFITTYEDGILYYEKGKLTRFPLDPNRNLSAAHCIVEDKKGFFWITTNKGLFQFAKADLIAYSRLTPEAQKQRTNPYYLYYTRENGFATNEFNGGCQPCAVRLPDGHVSLPSLNGLVWFEPEKIRPQLPDGKLIIDQVVENGKSKAVLQDSITFGLSPKQISLHVSTPYFGNQANIQLSYAITSRGKMPIGKDWVRLKADDPVIRFSELSSGEYTLIVRKVNGFGENNYSTKSIMLIVPKEWFETTWFRILCLLVFGLCIYFYIRFRTAYLQKQNATLETAVALRTQRLELTLGALKSSEAERNKQMHIQTQLVASISHDVRTPLKYILNLSERVHGLLEKGEFALVAGISENVVTSAQRMSTLIENMLAYIRTQVHHEPIKMHNVSLRALVYEKASLFTSIIAEQDNRFRNDVPGTYHVSSNSQLLGVVIHNLIDNANKYTFDGTLQVFTEIHVPYLHLIIADNGPGMPPHIINWFNNTPGSEQENFPVEEKKGLGLFIVKEIAALLDVRLKVENKNGTRVHIIFDMADQVLVGQPPHGTLDEGFGLEERE